MSHSLPVVLVLVPASLGSAGSSPCFRVPQALPHECPAAAPRPCPCVCPHPPPPLCSPCPPAPRPSTRLCGGASWRARRRRAMRRRKRRRRCVGALSQGGQGAGWRPGGAKPARLIGRDDACVLPAPTGQAMRGQRPSHAPAPLTCPLPRRLPAPAPCSLTRRAMRRRAWPTATPASLAAWPAACPAASRRRRSSTCAKQAKQRVSDGGGAGGGVGSTLGWHGVERQKAALCSCVVA